MKKIVDGIEIQMTSEEIAARQAREKENLEGTLVKRMVKLRHIRDNLLKETDWVGGTDVPQSLKDVWQTYRQALRDITKTEPVDMALSNITFPTKPS